MIRKRSWKEVLLSLAIAIVLMFFIFYGISTFYNAPNYEDYCKMEQYAGEINSSQDCASQGGDWKESPKPVGELNQRGYCDLYSKCGEEFNNKYQNYRRTIFMITLPLGAIILIAGIFVSVPSVSAGLMGGGILTMLYGLLQYWDELGDILRFIILGIILCALIWIGIRKLK